MSVGVLIKDNRLEHIGKRPQKKALKPFGFAPFRAPNRARTGDLLIKSQDFSKYFKKSSP